MLLVLFSFQSLAEDNNKDIENFSVIGQKESLPTRPGSAHVLTEEELKKFQYDDINRVLRSVPGVNLQEEDGFGLRPNIGFRGAHPHRSKKITILEDGVLIGPAPYSAPAAYYFPQMDKLGGIEIFKGVPSTRYGPNSIAGAINLLTRINDPGLEADISYGNFGYQKYDLSAGIEGFGILTIDATHIAHDGFKILPVDKPTGFERNNFTLRWDKSFKTMNQNLTLKFNWSDEESNETYLGLTEDDFATNPFQRYSASQDDLLRWKHQQFFASHSIQPSENFNIKTTLYHHEFYRAWFKNNGFFDSSIDVNEVLRTPNLAAFNQFYQVLTGASNSLLSSDRDVLRQTNNTRTYYSQGAQMNFDYELPGTTWEHLFSFSYRFHRDEVDRDHVTDFYSMQNNSLVLRNDLGQVAEKFNVGSAQAHTFTLGYEATLESLFIQTALRYEDISYEEFDELTQTGTQSDDEILAPGLGLFYELFNKGGVLFGVNKGFTPVGPGQASDIRPEESMNYEFGFRYNGEWGAELIGFYTDYTNILGTCTQSSGCTVANLDTRFNGGEAEIYGAEFLLNKDFKTGSVTVPVRFNGTLTQTRFNSRFSTQFNDWGIGTIDPGDPIPYIPEFQANLSVGLLWGRFSGFMNYNYLGEMADQAVSENRRFIPSRWVLDAVVRYDLKDYWQVYFKADNITAEEYAVSIRPQGLRPGKPQSFIVGMRYAFF